jgi:hypothetical protein
MQTPMFQPLFILGFIANFCFSYETLSIRNVSEPESNAPLDYTLAYKTSRLYGYNGESKFLTHSFIPTSCGANLSVYHTNPDIFPNGGSKEVPILLLNHGYPESSYIWRQVTPLISKRVPVFVPDVCLHKKKTQNKAKYFAASRVRTVNTMYQRFRPVYIFLVDLRSRQYCLWRQYSRHSRRPRSRSTYHASSSSEHRSIPEGQRFGSLPRRHCSNCGRICFILKPELHCRIFSLGWSPHSVSKKK